MPIVISIFDYLFLYVDRHMLSHVWFCDLMDHSLPNSPVHRITLTRILDGCLLPLEEFPHPGTETSSPLAPEFTSVFFTTEASSFVFRCSWVYTDVSSSNLLINGYFSLPFYFYLLYHFNSEKYGSHHLLLLHNCSSYHIPEVRVSNR